jgi:15-cis-phytoene synthase
MSGEAAHDDLTACAQLVERADPDRFLATMAAPVAARRILFPLHALNAEVARAPWLTQEPLVAQMRLQWWRDALAEIAAGSAVRRHHVTTALADILNPDLAAELDQLVTARYWDINREPFDDLTGLDRHLDHTSATLTSVAARALGPAETATARDYGWATGLANWLCATPELIRRGRAPLPDPGLQGIRLIAAEGLRRLARARANRKSISSAARPALLTGWQATTLLKMAEAEPDRVLRATLIQSATRKRLSLIRQSATGHW